MIITAARSPWPAAEPGFTAQGIGINAAYIDIEVVEVVVLSNMDAILLNSHQRW